MFKDTQCEAWKTNGRYLYRGKGGGLIFGGSYLEWGERYYRRYIQRIRGLQYTVEKRLYFLVIDTHFWVHIEQLVRWVLKSIQW
jgi:hypothetical protein